MSATFDPAKDVTVPQVAAYLGCSTESVRRWIRVGTLPARLCLGRTIVSRAHMLEFEATGSVELNPAPDAGTFTVPAG